MESVFEILFSDWSKDNYFEMSFSHVFENGTWQFWTMGLTVRNVSQSVQMPEYLFATCVVWACLFLLMNPLEYSPRTVGCSKLLLWSA